MALQIDTRNPRHVRAEVESVSRRFFHEGDSELVPCAFDWATQCFTGKYANYDPIDAGYHDFEHTLQGTLCLSRLLAGRQRARARPALSQADFENCVLAILFHDTGYLKERSDRDGTGAKYTAVHVTRSCQFARDFLAPPGVSEHRVAAIQNTIRCTGINADSGAKRCSARITQRFWSR